MKPRKIYLLPFSRLKLKNKIFEEPLFKSLREFLLDNQVEINTLDYFDYAKKNTEDVLVVLNHPGQSVIKRFIKRIRGILVGGSLAEEKYFFNYKKYFSFFSKKILYQGEPPTVSPISSHELKWITRTYSKAFSVAKREGFDYFYFPTIQEKIIEPLFNNRERGFITLINANKEPASYENELYSERLCAIKYFSEQGLDLYGMGWDTPIAFSAPFKQYIDKSFRGSTDDKYKTLSKYTFAICYENGAFEWYITEKLFDCFFTGTIPIYLGAPDIKKYVPSECFIDFREFGSYEKLNTFLKGMTEAQIDAYRAAAAEYVTNSSQFKLFSMRHFGTTLLETISHLDNK
ncbi:MAG: glycosyltransferase family 10 [Candidatus Paceibacterota bacterium]|jgi:hypothetical protein